MSLITAVIFLPALITSAFKGLAIFLSPLLNRLSLHTEENITGNRYDFQWEQFWKDIRRAIRIAIGNFIIEYTIFAAWFIFIMFYPPADYFTYAFMFAVGCYFYGFSLIDYINERRRFTIEESVTFIRENAGFSVGIGLIFSAIFFIPWSVGVVFAPVLGIVAATIGMHILVDLNRNPYAIRRNSSEEQAAAD